MSLIIITLLLLQTLIAGGEKIPVELKLISKISLGKKLVKGKMAIIHRKLSNKKKQSLLCFGSYRSLFVYDIANP